MRFVTCTSRARVGGRGTLRVMRALDDPQLRPFLPLLYLAWADGDLVPDELSKLGALVDSQPWLDHDARARIHAALDEPPAPAELHAWLGAIRRAAGTLPESERHQIAGLCAALTEGDPDPRVAEALETALAILGVHPRELAHVAFPSSPRAPAPEHARRFDPAAMRALLDGDYAPVRDAVRTFLDDPARRLDPAMDHHAKREKVLAELRALAEAGFGARAFPGVTSEGDDLGPFMASFETLGFGDLSLLVKYGVQFGLFGGSIFFLGEDAQRERYLADVASLALPGCYAMTELGHGSNVMALETTATWEDGAFVVHTPSESARKEWIGNAACHGRMATVFAQLHVGEEEHGVHALLVPIRDENGDALPGVRIDDCGHKLGLNGVDNGRLWFDRVRVPRENLLSRFGRVTEDGVYESEIPSATKRFFTMLGTLVAGRICVGSGAVSASKAGLAIALRYGAARRQFGPPGEPEIRLNDYPAHRRRLLPVLAQSYATSFAIDEVRSRYLKAGEDEMREIEALAAGVKAYATDHATFALQRCREACGGQGYLSVNRIGPLKSDTDVFTTFEGDNTVLMQLAGKALISGWKRRLGDSRTLGMLRFVGRKVAREVTKANPIVSRRTTADHLRSRDFHLGAMRYREEQLTESAALRIKARIDDGEPPHAAFIAAQTDVIAAAHAHVERFVLETFVQRIDAAPEELREPLDTLCDLWALWRIEAALAYYLEHGVVESAKAGAVRECVDALLERVAPDALTYVESFGIPDACLGAPIAFEDPATRPMV